MRFLHISDTHNKHLGLIIPKEIDLIIFSGDCSNPRNSGLNANEVEDFIEWYSKLNIKYKVFVAGNHDSSIESRLVPRKYIEDKGIIYLENESTVIEGINIWGSPYTPTFGNWCFMKPRHKLHDLWVTIPVNTDIIVTHGPPKNCLDLSFNSKNELEFCGCEALRKRIFNVKPKYHLFGHIHSMKGVTNAGTLKYANLDTIFSNGSCVLDGDFAGGVSSHGNIFEI